MFKFGIAAVLFTAIAGTGYVVARSNTEPSAPVTVAPATSASTRAGGAAPIAKPRAAITTSTAQTGSSATTSAADGDRMLSTVPETVETSCETTPWSLGVRRCMLASVRHKQALACAR